MDAPGLAYSAAMSEPTAPLPPGGGPGPYAGPPPGYGPPPRGGSGGTVAAAIVGALLVAGCILAAVVANSGSTPSSASAPTVTTTGPVQVGGGTSSGADVPQPVPSADLTTSAYTPPPVPTPTPTPTHEPLNGSAVNRTFEVYMNALLYHNLSALKSATCPRLRHTETGTALHHKYIHRWKGYSYQIYPDLDYVRLSAKVYFDVGGTAVYDWYVERDSTDTYYVCGFLS